MSELPGPRRLRPRLQTGEKECGLACLGMVLEARGLEVSTAALRRQLKVGERGVNASEIKRAAATFGLACRAFSVPDPASFATLPAPAILHWQKDHYVVFERVSRRGVHLVDPATGRRKISWAELTRRFSGVVLTFEPTSSGPRPEDPPPRSTEAPPRGLRRWLPAFIASSLFVHGLMVSAAFLAGWLGAAATWQGWISAGFTWALASAALVALDASLTRFFGSRLPSHLTAAGQGFGPPVADLEPAYAVTGHDLEPSARRPMEAAKGKAGSLLAIAGHRSLGLLLALAYLVFTAADFAVLISAASLLFLLSLGSWRRRAVRLRRREAASENDPVDRAHRLLRGLVEGAPEGEASWQGPARTLVRFSSAAVALGLGLQAGPPSAATVTALLLTWWAVTAAEQVALTAGRLADARFRLDALDMAQVVALSRPGWQDSAHERPS